MRAALTLQDEGTVLPGVDDPELYLQVHAGDFVIDEHRDAAELYTTYPRRRVELNGTVHTPNSGIHGERVATK